jgi:ABC-2 type transport system permease protein
MAVMPLARRLRTTSQLGWAIESNWADPFVFVVYSVVRPLATSLILAGMYWAVAGVAARPKAFAALYLGNVFHEYVTRMVIGMGWAIVEEREDYETLKYVYTSPIGMLTYLWGRSSVKFVLASVSVLLTLTVGWFLLGVRWDWAHVRWLPLGAAFVTGLVATQFLGFLLAGWALMLPRIGVVLNEGISIGLYLMCGVIYPVDLLPRGLQELSLLLPFTWWYEALRRFLLGAGASARVSALSDAQLLGALALSTLVFAIVSRAGYFALERRARQTGRIDQTSLF